MDEKNQHPIFVVGPITSVAKDLAEFFKSDRACKVIEVDGFVNVDPKILKSRPCILVGSIESNQQLSAAISLLKVLNLKHNRDKIKVILVGKQNFAHVAEAMRILCVTDFIAEPTSARTVIFKGRLQLNTIKATAKLANDNSKNKSIKSSKNEQSEETSEEEVSFYFKNKKAKKVNEKFLIEVSGPDPESGSWEKSDSEIGEDTCWNWKSKNSLDKDVGNVKTYGKKPVFNPETKQWQLAAKEPKLIQEKNGKLTELGLIKKENGEAELVTMTKTKESTELDNAALDLSDEESGPIYLPKVDKELPEERHAEDEQEVSKPLSPLKIDVSSAESSPDVKKGILSIAGILAKIQELTTRKDDFEQADVAISNEKEIASKTKTPPVNKEDAIAAAKEKESVDDQEALEKQRQISAAKSSKTKSDPNRELGVEEGKENKVLLVDEEALGVLSVRAENERQAKKRNADAKLKVLLDRLSSISSKNEAERKKNEKSRPALEAALEAVAARERAEQVEDSAKRSALLEEEKLSKIAEKDEEFAGLNDPILSGADTVKRKRNKNLDEIAAPTLEKIFTPATLEKDSSDADAAKKRDGDSELSSSLGDLHTNEKIDNTSSTSSTGSDRLKSKLNAKDSDAFEEDVLWQAQTASASEKKSLLWFYRKKVEIDSLPGTWISTEGGYFFLRKKIAVDKIRILQEALPIWIYQGSREPEFEFSSQRWRFLDRQPVQILSSDGLPMAIANYLAGLLIQEKSELMDESVQGKDLKSYLETKAPLDFEIHKNNLKQIERPEFSLAPNDLNKVGTQNKEPVKSPIALSFLKKMLNQELEPQASSTKSPVLVPSPSAIAAGSDLAAISEKKNNVVELGLTPQAIAREPISSLSIAAAMAKALHEGRKDSSQIQSTSPVSVNRLAVELAMAQVSSLPKNKAVRAILDYYSLHLSHLSSANIELRDTGYQVIGAGNNDAQIFSLADLKLRMRQRRGILREVMTSGGLVIFLLESRADGLPISTNDYEIIQRVGRAYTLPAEPISQGLVA